MTADKYFDWHIPHRVNLLIAFRERYSGRSRPEMDRERFRDFYRCAKDMSLMMVRFFCEELGIGIPKKKTDIEDKGQWHQNFQNAKLDKNAVKADPIYPKLKEVLRAANRAVAHLEPGEVDHAFKYRPDEERIFDVIDWMEKVIELNIYQPAGRNLKKSMSLVQNDMKLGIS